MNTEGFLSETYRVLLHLYPRKFHSEFGDEMYDVYCMSLRDASARGALEMWSIFFHELGDFPLNLLREAISSLEVNQMIERILAHKKQSRWQRAGGLGFAIGFLLLELITGLINLIETDFTQYSSFFGIVKYSIPMEGAAVSSGMPQSTPFDLVGLAAILVAGLVAGWVFGRAAQPDHQLRFTLAGMTAFCGAFVWIFLGSLALRTANRVVGLLGALVIIALMGALISTIFAVIAIPSSRSRLLRFGAVGLYAFLIGIAASLLAFLPAGFVVLPVAAVLWLSNIQGILGLSMLLLAMISGCVLGWVYGVWVGGELEKTQLRVSLSPVEA